MGDLELSRNHFYALGQDGLTCLKSKVLALRDTLQQLAPHMDPEALVGEGGPVRLAVCEIVRALGLPPIEFSEGPPHRDWTISYTLLYTEVFHLEFRPETIGWIPPRARAFNLAYSLFKALVSYFVQHHNSESLNVVKMDDFQREVEECLGLKNWLESGIPRL